MSKNITAILNNNCNKRCNYCYQKEMLTDIKSEISDIFIKKINRYLFNNRNEDIILSIIGGEPLIDVEKFIFFIKSINEKDIKIILYTNLDNFNKDIIYELSKFKEVEIYTELDLFEDKNVFLSKKYKDILFIKNKTNFKINGHILIYNANYLMDYFSFIKRNEIKIEKIGFKFSLLNIYTNNYSMDDLKKIMQFYDLLNNPNIFNKKIYLIRNFLNNYIFESFKDTHVSCESCMNKTFNYDGKESKCTYSMIYKQNKKIDNKDCLDCSFNKICEPCEMITQDIKYRKCEFIKQILELQYYLLSFQFEYDKESVIKNDYSVNLSVDLGHNCNLKCDFCYYHYNDIKNLDINKFKKFIKNNFLKIDSIDAFVGGEPLLYLNDEYRFLFKYIENIYIITNGTIKNNFVEKYQDFFNITISIHNFEDLNKIYWNQFKKYDVLLVLSNSVCQNLYKIISFLDDRDIEYRIVELYSYSDEQKNKTIYNSYKNELKKMYNYSRTFRDAINKTKKYNKYCFENKLLIFDNKVAPCTYYEVLKYKYNDSSFFITDRLDTYIINKNDIINNFENLKQKKKMLFNKNILCPAKILNTEDDYYIRKELIKDAK